MSNKVALVPVVSGDGKTPERKVALPAIVTGIGSLLVLVAGWLGLDPVPVTEATDTVAENIEVVVAGVAAIVGAIQFLIGYFVPNTQKVEIQEVQAVTSVTPRSVDEI